jgi:hypothetical protein
VTARKRLGDAAVLCLRVVLFAWGLVLLSSAIAPLAAPDAVYSDDPMPPPWWARVLFALWSATFAAVLLVSPRALARHPRWLAAGAAAVLVWPALQFVRDGRGLRDAPRFAFFLCPLALQAALAVLARRGGTTAAASGVTGVHARRD